MQYVVQLCLDLDRVHDILFQQGEPVVRRQVGQILFPAGAEIIDNCHVVAVADKSISQVGADEAATAGKEDMHIHALPVTL